MENSKPSILLVHGAWQASWCWKYVIPFLESKGFRVIAPDLPGHGVKGHHIQRMEDYVRSIGKILEQEEEPITLVGHSMGGMVISQVADALPKKVSRLVYISGFLPRNGQSLSDLMRSQFNSPPPFTTSQDGSSAILKLEAAREKFFHDCSELIATEAIELIRPQAISTFKTPAILTSNFESVPKTYLTCLNDRSVWPDTQKAMYTLTHCERVVQIQSGHAPYFSQPETLANLLAKEMP